MAFPTTSVLDTFDRANEDPLATASSGATWSTLSVTGLGGTARLRVVSNQAERNGSGTGSQYISSSSYGPDCEAYVTVVSLNATCSFSCWLRIADAATGNQDGYLVTSTDSTTKFFRCDNDSFTQLGATVTQTWSAGDSMGSEMIGTALACYRKSGSWALVDSRTDSTYTAAGPIALQAVNASGQPVFDDFGGGTVVTGGVGLVSDTPMPIMGRGATW